MFTTSLFTIANKLKTVPLSQEFEKQRYLEGKKDESELSNSFQDYLLRPLGHRSKDVLLK